MNRKRSKLSKTRERSSCSTVRIIKLIVNKPNKEPLRLILCKFQMSSISSTGRNSEQHKSVWTLKMVLASGTPIWLIWLMMITLQIRLRKLRDWYSIISKTNGIWSKTALLQTNGGIVASLSMLKRPLRINLTIKWFLRISQKS